MNKRTAIKKLKAQGVKVNPYFIYNAKLYDKYNSWHKYPKRKLIKLRKLYFKYNSPNYSMSSTIKEDN